MYVCMYVCTSFPSVLVFKPLTGNLSLHSRSTSCPEKVPVYDLTITLSSAYRFPKILSVTDLAVDL